MILQPLIASLNPESLSMPTGTLRNTEALPFHPFLSSFSLSLSLSLSLCSTLFSRFIRINLRSVSPFCSFPSRSTLLSGPPFPFWPMKTKNAHCGLDRWSLMSGIRFRPAEQSFVLIGNDATSLSRQRFTPSFSLAAIHPRKPNRLLFSRLQNA